MLSRKSKETIQRPIENEVDYQEGILRVSAPQFNKTNYPVKLNSRMTAGDLLSRYTVHLFVCVERRKEGLIKTYRERTEERLERRESKRVQIETFHEHRIISESPHTASSNTAEIHNSVTSSELLHSFPTTD